jgi:hypothetical protein
MCCGTIRELHAVTQTTFFVDITPRTTANRVVTHWLLALAERRRLGVREGIGPD